MSYTNTFHEMAIKNAPKQQLIVDALLEEAPILANLPMVPSSNGLSNVYEELVAVTGADITAFDAALGTMSVDSKLKYTSLSSIAGEIEVGEDKALQLGGADAYFASKLPPVLKKTGNDVEKTILYNNLRAYASAQGKLVDAGGTGSTNYTILFVKWSLGEMCGVYDPKGFGNGKVFDLLKLNGGQVYKNASNILSYGMRIKSYIGMQMANPRYIAGIVNCDIVNDDFTGTRTFPTETMIDDAIEEARLEESMSAIICHPKVATYLARYKAARMSMMPGDNNVNRMFSFWNGIPVMTSRNMLAGTETKVTIA
jgi:hypothetical protein